MHCDFDIGLLSGFIAAAEQYDKHIVAHGVVDTITGAVIDFHLAYLAFENPALAGISQTEATNARVDTRFGLPIAQAGEPCLESAAFNDIEHDKL